MFNKKLSTKLLSALSLVALFTSVLFVSTGCTFGGSDVDSEGKKSEANIGLTLAPTNLDIRTQSGTALEQVLLDNVYEGLVTVDGDAKVIPSLAQSWDISDDSLTYTFHLKEGIHFADNTPVTAKDVVNSVLDVRDNKLNGYKALEKLTTAQATDDTTVEFVLSKPDPEFLWTLAGRVGIVIDTTRDVDYKTTAFGTGPFTVESWDGASKLRLVKNPNYWDANAAKLDAINVVYITDKNAAVTALQDGSVDILAPVVQNLATPFENNSDYVLEVGEGTDKFELDINNSVEPLNNVDVRKAIRYAVDNAEIIASRGRVDAPLGGPITVTEPGYEDLTDLFPYDAQKAKDLLAGAGYTTENPLKLTLKYATDIYGTELGELLTSQFEKVGIKLTIISQDFATWLVNVYDEKDYELTIVDQNDPRAFYHWASPDYYYGYDNKEVQDLYEQATLAKSEDEEGELLAKAARIVSKDAAAEWLFNYRTTVARRSNIEGLTVNYNQSRLPLKELRYTD